MNILEEGSNELVYVDYSDLLEQILRVLQNQQTQELFRISSDRHHLLIDIDVIASQVASLLVANPLGNSANSVNTATVNLSPGSKERFPGQVRELRDCLKQQLEVIVNQSGQSNSIQDFVTNLVTKLQAFKGNTAKLDFTYPFGNYQGLQKQRLSFENDSSSSIELLKLHKLTITVQNTRNFNIQLREGLENYINVQFEATNESEREELVDILDDLEANHQSDFYTLKKIVDTETLGKLKKEAQIYYLEFLKENIYTTTSLDNLEGTIYLQDLIRRLKLINQYINDSEKADGDYNVNYAGTQVNYRDMFSRGDAFDMLPIVPKIEGYLGETTDENRGEVEFIFGLKLKFNNPVQSYGAKNVFEYYLNLISPDSEEHKAEIADFSRKEAFARKVLKITFLYYFVFTSNNPSKDDYTPQSDLDYDPISAFEEKALPFLRDSDDTKKQKLFRNLRNCFIDLFKIENKIKLLKQQMQKLLKRPTIFPAREYPLYISVKKGILEQEVSNISNKNTFFKSVLRGNPKEVLKYISIGEANAEANSLLTLPSKIVISDIRYFSTDECQTFTMEYDDIENIPALPVLLSPMKEGNCKATYEKFFMQRKLVLFSYNLERNKLEPQKAFVYRFTFILLTYICLKILLHTQSRLFIPILRLHLSNKQDNSPIEKFMVSLSKVLSHLLNEEHRSNSQGIDIRNLSYKIPNALSSLYHVLPKKFYFSNASNSPQLDKLAIVIVSSRESDSWWGSKQKISNLMGEVVGIKRSQDGSVRLQLLKTFSDNYNNQKLFSEPTVIIDEIDNLYRKGYRHFIYIAKAPYSSTLHMTQWEGDDGLFFMSRDVISALKAQHDDIKIYPMFFDKYYVAMLKPLKVNSLYIQDTMALTNLVEDPSKQSVVFFNLFNGMKIGRDDERNYRGVISYATLLNVYKGILDDEGIRTGLIFNTKLKNDILQYLTLFHFSRYEKDKNISLKLDPYENLIGDDSVGKIALFNHMTANGNFNSLAFLTEVRKVLNVQ